MYYSCRRQVKVVLEDVLQTEIGQSFLSSSGQSFQLKNQSEHRRAARARRSDQTSTGELKDTRRSSVALRSRKDSAEAKDASPCPEQIESTSCTENESCSSKDQTKRKKSRVKHTNSTLKLPEPSEESSDSCSPRESDSPECVEISDQMSEQSKPTTIEEKEASSLDGSLQDDEAVPSECEAGHSPLSSLEEECNLEEDEPDSEVTCLSITIR